jgi:heme/copper-type cytochrome/quinol oxidase subunit 2
MNTSIRGHGKWGDFLVALIPLSWCCNILINSNFILRMIEWQNESSLFTIRVQGKQWYWVYKYDANTSQAINSTPKNIGHNRWVIFSKNESYHADTYYQAIHLAAQLEFQDSYSGLIEKNETSKKLLTPNTLISDSTILSTNWHTSQQINLSNNDLADFSDNTELFLSNSNTENSSWIYLDLKSTNQSSKESYITQNITLSDNSLTDFNNSIELPLLNNISEQYTLANLNKFFNVDLYNNTIGSNSYYDFLRLDETSDSTGNLRALSSTVPFRLVKGIINQHNIHVLSSVTNEQTFNKLLFLQFNIINTGELNKDKELIPETLWGFRQKKYKRIKKFNFKPQAIYDPITFKILGFNNVNLTNTVDIAGVDLSYNLLRKDKKLNYSNLYNYYLAMKINRNKTELVPITLARRLLRTKRTLVLPAHVNLTVITNSYDVVHSWFIPGLGLKLDCVPGRSTHHTFYIDNIGFYYGQCAEICGRYHHHMPIRLCALPYEQFVVWWHVKGLPRLNRLSVIKKNKFLNKVFDKDVTPKKLVYQNT